MLDVVETDAGVAWCLAPTQTMFRMTAFTRPRLEGPLCKATSKLAEALAWLKHEPRGGVAIDLGESLTATLPAARDCRARARACPCWRVAEGCRSAWRRR